MALPNNKILIFWPQSSQEHCTCRTLLHKTFPFLFHMHVNSCLVSYWPTRSTDVHRHENDVTAVLTRSKITFGYTYMNIYIIHVINRQFVTFVNRKYTVLYNMQFILTSFVMLLCVHGSCHHQQVRPHGFLTPTLRVMHEPAFLVVCCGCHQRHLASQRGDQVGAHLEELDHLMLLLEAADRLIHRRLLCLHLVCKVIQGHSRSFGLRASTI